jgi:hypothetical protein
VQNAFTQVMATRMPPCASVYPSFHSVTQRSRLDIVVAESSTLTSLLQDDPKIALELSDCSSLEPVFAKGARKKPGK